MRDGTRAVDDGTFRLRITINMICQLHTSLNREVFRPICRKSAPVWAPRRVRLPRCEKQAALSSSFSPTWSLREANDLQFESRDLERGYRQPRGKSVAAFQYVDEEKWEEKCPEREKCTFGIVGRVGENSMSGNSRRPARMIGNTFQEEKDLKSYKGLEMSKVCNFIQIRHKHISNIYFLLLKNYFFLTHIYLFEFSKAL